jgi:ABC-type uncharacterized transport system permease subunit
MGPHSILRYVVFGAIAGVIAGFLVALLHWNITLVSTITGVLAALSAGFGVKTGGGTSLPT